MLKWTRTSPIHPGFEELNPAGNERMLTELQAHSLHAAAATVAPGSEASERNQVKGGQAVQSRQQIKVPFQG